MKIRMLLVLAATVMAAHTGTALARDRDNNPPGPAGGPGTNWENKPGLRGGLGTSPNRHGYWRGHYWYHHDNAWLRWNAAKTCWAPDFDGNPPGPAGGVGTNWENPPGPEGGPGASPDRWGRCR